MTHIRGNRRAVHLINLQVELVRQMLDDKKTDGQIMETLSMPQRTYYRYKAKIIDLFTKEWAEVIKESLESRSLKILQSLQWAYDLNKEIAEDNTVQAKDRMKACQAMIEIQVDIYYLLKRGPRLG